jgi:hypothetical protein
MTLPARVPAAVHACCSIMPASHAHIDNCYAAALLLLLLLLLLLRFVAHFITVSHLICAALNLLHSAAF